ncbi:hypothetical protein [Natrialba sp. INN-245]|uniref:hypothetical protein n=1 Tax=Natrialba sp. INN-245 TaxID=2690967 RepID=UPI00135B5AFF|nr:hypothetical protein [Natrialba sp. INN-245]
MWPTDLYPISGTTGLESADYFAHGWVLEVYRVLFPYERAAVQFAAMVLVSLVLLGTLQGRGSDAITTSRRSPVISTCIGLPSLLVVTVLVSAGYFIVGSSLGTFFGVIFVTIGAAVVPASAAIGFVALGQSIVSRLGQDRLWLGVLIGSLVFGLAGFSVPATVVVATLATMLGMGTIVRILFGPGGSTNPDERTVPPANKI